jgi:DDE domain
MLRRLSFNRHRFPPEIIRRAIWLYFRFSLSLRDVEELLAERSVDTSYETIRRWAKKFGPAIARRLKALRPNPSPRWHLDEMVCRGGGKHVYLWRAVDDEGEVLDILVQRRRDADAAGPISSAPSSSKLTAEGVRQDPRLLGINSTLPSRHTPTALLVAPKSIPTITDAQSTSGTA